MNYEIIIQTLVKFRSAKRAKKIADGEKKICLQWTAIL